MNLRDLEYIIAVADTRHFGKAAKRCFVSQPTLSGQINKLEQELGIKIFERTNRSVIVTPVGRNIIHHAHNMIEQMHAIRQIALAHRDPIAGPLRAGIIPTLSPYLIPLILQPLKQQHADMQLVVSEEKTEILISRLLNHEIDAAILATPVDQPGIESRALFDEPFWVAYPLDHHFYLKQKINRKDLQQEELLTLSEGNCLADQVMEIAGSNRNRNTHELEDLRASSIETLIQFVANSSAITLVPALALRGSWTSGSGVAVQPLSIRGASRRVSLVSRTSFPRPEALQALTETIQNHLPNTVTILN